MPKQSGWTIADAQYEVRSVYLGGLVGQIVSAAVWLASALVAVNLSPKQGAWTLVFGGMVIFPATQLVLKLAGRTASLSKDNPLSALAMQVAFAVPLLLPLIGAATLARPDWFYPAFMLVVGVHYLPFAFLYGQRHFLALAGLMIGIGIAIGYRAPDLGLYAAWITAALLAAFAVVGWTSLRAEQRRRRSAAAD